VASFEWLIGLRYTRAKRRNGFISFISMASAIGIALGVMALIVVLSVMNGFQREVRGRMLEATAHVQASGTDGQLADWPTVLAELSRHPAVRGAAPDVQAQALLANAGTVQGAMVRGVDPAWEPKVSGLASHVVEGRLDALKPGEFGAVLGVQLARALGVHVGDKVTFMVPQGNVTPAGMVPRLKPFTVVGLLRLDMFQYDAALALIHLQDAQRLYRMGDQVSAVRFKLDDPMQAPRVAVEMARSNPRPLYLSDWTMENTQYFQAVQMEKRMMSLILLIIIVVAAFQLVSSLVMTVTDKQADIAILRTLGATPTSILKIFVIQGAAIGIAGTLLGLGLGVLLAFNVGDVVAFVERMLGVQMLSPQIYLISRLPSDVQWGDVVQVTAVSLAFAFLATLYPSWRASRVQPAEALRYE
jgi:lipoprotein-releasing system permease protein